MKILMVEDDKSVSQMMELFFKKEGWEQVSAYDGEEAVEIFQTHPRDFDIITLDLNLPKKDGIQVAKEIRRISETVPIIMVTARDSESDQVLGLGVGADDYVTKPFSPIALIARIKALYRRVMLEGQPRNLPKNIPSNDFDLETNHIRISKSRREVYFDENRVEGLTPKEFDLLYTMAQKPKQVFSREQLLELVWGYEYFGEERTVDAHIKKLRQKLEKSSPQIIQTVWGVGYKFDDSQVNA
ncbi:response regulator transcription factor [Lactobacillus delbrueckii]|uniref:response regulator transcription factor n=1 Tax=Lactobacillus delbrueckii TaxID=1584 RepID=UPI00068111A0|nr:response regulator transcription factor [Lactobacillus delbrueckii]APP02677.1 DNA-binding response regulator [Lactobacillus delbrueckii subsp. indicus]KNE30852.1 PhoP family transcriptional regulator [Lactobacillus delbrueckii subsp. indicus]KRL78057.1 two-component system, response regulator [Lactobacillus delbrueckii subsp. indicus DSM 15996]